VFRRSRPGLQPQKHHLTLFADYFQLHVADDDSGGDLSDAWTEVASARGLAVVDGIVGVSTARNVDVPVVVAVSAEPPDLPFDADSVVEGDLECKSGRVVVMGCTDYYPEAMRLAVPPGWYRVRAVARGLSTVREQWLDAEDEYRIELWPASPTGVAVVKAHAWV